MTDFNKLIRNDLNKICSIIVGDDENFDALMQCIDGYEGTEKELLNILCLELAAVKLAIKETNANIYDKIVVCRKIILNGEK